MKLQATRTVRVTNVEAITPLVKRFTLVCAAGNPLPAFSGGSHIGITLRDGAKVWQNSYSLTSAPGNTDFYQIAVRREDPTRSKGGSIFLHERVLPGTTLEITAPNNFFPLARHARKHLLIAGGIGITPFLSQLVTLRTMGANYELHYAYRSPELGAFCEQLSTDCNERLHCYIDSEGQLLNPACLLAHQPLGTHVYVCGPHALIADVKRIARELGWPDSQVHSEEFAPPPPQSTDPFTVQLAHTGKEVTVSGEETLLEALARSGVWVDRSCRVGRCGTCMVGVRSGDIEHSDTALSDEERAEGKTIIACVSRAKGNLVLDL